MSFLWIVGDNLDILGLRKYFLEMHWRNWTFWSSGWSFLETYGLIWKFNVLENLNILGLRIIIVWECIGEFEHFGPKDNQLFCNVLQNSDILGLVMVFFGKCIGEFWHSRPEKYHFFGMYCIIWTCWVSGWWFFGNVSDNFDILNLRVIIFGNVLRNFDILHLKMVIFETYLRIWTFLVSNVFENFDILGLNMVIV